VRARYPNLDAANVVNRLINTARDLGPSGRDEQFGYGEVDPLAALRDDVTEVSVNPLVTADPPAGRRPSGSPAAPHGNPSGAADAAAGWPSGWAETGSTVAVSAATGSTMPKP